MRILVVEDEETLVGEICRALEKQRYIVDTALNGEEALERVFMGAYDVILLDIMLPEKDGFDVLAELREEKISTPVLMLTAKGSIEDKINGLDRGADDYLAKPFSMEELFARIRALLRRTNRRISPILKVGSVSLDPVKREVSKNGTPLELTAKEFSILEFLMYNLNRAISRVTIAEHVWGDDFDPWTMSNSIDVHIKNLRKKIESPKEHIIHTLRGVGYIIKDTRE